MCKRITLVGPVSSRADATSWSSFRRLDSSSFYSCPNRSGLLASAVLVALLIIISKFTKIVALYCFNKGHEIL